jgi:hypothetical protein
MINVLDAVNFDQFKEFVFKNFTEAKQKLDTIGDVAVDYASSKVITTTPGGGGDIFDTVYLKDAATWITRDSSGNLVFRDAIAGSITLSQIKTLLAILWTFGDAFGVKMSNLAGTELMVGITEDADGVTIFNDTSEVE